MSLINDALRRASQQKRARAPEPSSLPPLQPVEYRRRPNLWPLAIIVPSVCILLGLAGFFFWAFAEHRRSVPPPATTSAAADSRDERTESTASVGTDPVVERRAEFLTHQPAEAVSPAPQPLVTEAPTATKGPPAVPRVVVSVTNASSAAETNTNPEATAAEAPAAAPPPKLQGIYYSRSRPSAVLNGKAVRVGEIIEGVRVISIERESVTLEQGGKTNVLRLP